MRPNFPWLLVGGLLVAINASALNILVIGDSDKSNQPYVDLAYSGCPSAIATYGNSATDTCTWKYKTATSDAGYAANLREYLNSDYDHFVLISSKYGKQLPAVIADFPNAKITSSSVSFPTTPLYKNVQGAIFSEDESGFLAGALAGLTTTSRTVGVIGGNPIASVLKYSNGFAMGVETTCVGCRILRQYAYSFTSQSEGEAIAASFLNAGADVIFGAGGKTGSYGIQYAANRRAFVIGVDSDEGAVAPFNDASKVASHYILSSAMKRVDTSVLLSLKDRFQGTFTQTNRIMDATAGGVSLAPGANSVEVQTAMAKTVPLLIKGTNNSCPVTRYRTVTDHLASINQQLQGKAISTKISSTGMFTATTADTLNVELGKWVQMAGVFGLSPPDLQSHTFVHIPSTNLAVLFGGQDGTGVVNSVTYLFDYDYRRWTIISDATNTGVTAPKARYQHIAVALDSQTLLIQGGRSGVGSTATLGDMWKLNVITKTWTQVSLSNSVDLSLSAHAATLANNELYIFGGVTSDQKLSSSFYRYSVDTGAIAAISTPSSTAFWPDARQKATLTTINSTHIALFGGSVTTGPTNTLAIYAIVQKVWVAVSPTGTAPAIEGHAAVFVEPHRILYMGGRDSQAASAQTFYYNTVQGKWVFTESQNLAVGTNVPAAMTLVQSQAVNACVAIELADTQLCTPNTRPLVFLYGGVQQDFGATTAFYVMSPMDEVPPRPIVSLNLAMVVVLNALAAIGSLTTIAAMIGLVMYRSHPVIRSASPAFAVLITLGILVAHMSVFTHVNIGATKTGLTATIWLMASGFIMAFAAMFVKTHRIYSIFTSKIRINLPQKILLLRTAAICSIYIIVWTAVWPIREELVAVGDSDWVRGTGDHFQSLGFGLIGVMLVFLIGLSYMAFKTRNVWQKFNETLYIGYSAYAVTVSAIIILPLLAFLSSPPVVDTLSCLVVEMSLYTMLVAVIGTKFWMIRQAKADEAGDDQTASVSVGVESADEGILKCKTCKQALTDAGRRGTSSGTKAGVTSSAANYRRVATKPGVNAMETAPGSVVKTSVMRADV
ncbi:hypothetical protein HDU89_000944 [Geranomyces variabilis]|nr:hypothetical protein HDU89_000944 [Geranomyces variabilis]